MVKKAIAVLCMCAATLLLAGCGFKSKHYPPPPCSDPLVCAVIKVVKDAKCQLPWNWSKGNFITIKNTNPSKRIIVKYLEHVRHINQLIADQEIEKTVLIEPNKPEGLGCASTGSEAEKYDLWSHVKISACFLTTSGCVFSKPTPQKPSDTRSQSCERECATNGRFCLSGTLDPSVKEEKDLADAIVDVNNQLFSPIPVPKLVDLDKLTTAITNISNVPCSHGPLYVDASSKASSQGDECRLGFQIPSHSKLDGFEVVLPGTLEGEYYSTPGTAYEIVGKVAETSAYLRLFDKSGTDIAQDQVTVIRGNARSLHIDTEHSYCVVLSAAD